MHELFLEAWERWNADLYRHCFFRLYDQEKAHDAVQEIYTRFWNYLQSGRTVDNARAFLYRIATNYIIDQSRKHREDSLDELMEAGPHFEPSESPDESGLKQHYDAKQLE